jgi:uncharacterized protein
MAHKSQLAYAATTPSVNARSEMSASLPIFPLNMVLYPDGLLPLRIFEPRYLDLVSRCLREDLPFVVCLISEGIETGRARFHPFGTSARIVDWDQGPGGILHVQCMGERRARVRSSTVEPSGLNYGEVTLLAVPEQVPVPLRHRPLADLLRRQLSQLQVWHSANMRPDDACWAADRLCELLPLSLTQRQLMLEIDDPIDNVVFVGRPAFGQEESTISLFKLMPDGEAVRTTVKLGRSSVNTIEVIEGLQPGDQVILSDMSTYDDYQRVRLN